MKTLLYFLLIFSNLSWGQQLGINPDLTQSKWTAKWISCPNVSRKAYGVYHFRKQIDISSIPSKYIIHVSADNRYRLFINGLSIGYGPARGDLYHWNFESFDIAPYLKKGKNTIAATVWNMAEHAAVAQISQETGFLLQSDLPENKAIDSNIQWKVSQDIAYSPCSTDNGARLWTYMVVGPGDRIDGNKYPWDWQNENFDDTNWAKAIEIDSPHSFGYGSDNKWTLMPSTIPLMEETRFSLTNIRQNKGLNDVKKLEFPISIPPNQKITLLIDNLVETVAYPEITVSGGKASQIKLTYSEALFKNREKQNRNDIEGLEIMGNYDIFVADGGKSRVFSTLWYKAFRYVEIEIETQNEALILEKFDGIYTGYPFKEMASFKSNDQSMTDIWKVGWRTARLCAGETYFDCPYYEQLQYEGDTRIQALISLYVSGDDRLMKKAINDFYLSRVAEGLTQGRYPSHRTQVITPFSLFWVSMLYDFMMHRKDDAFLKKYSTAIKGVLDWHHDKINPKSNMLGSLPWWKFVDWANEFKDGEPEGAINGNSSILTLQYVYTLEQAASIFEYLGDNYQANEYRKTAKTLSDNSFKQCFNLSKNLMADTPDQKIYSQHASIMGVLSGSIPSSLHQKVMTEVLNDKSLIQATFYYRFYLNQALKKAGMANLYYGALTPWRDMLKMGLSTFAEKPEPTRSDCHAWSASPNYDFLATICGIMPNSIGFDDIIIAPALGELTTIEGNMPHPKGEIKMKLTKLKNEIIAEITIPENTKGKFVWQNKTWELKEGFQKIIY